MMGFPLRKLTTFGLILALAACGAQEPIPPRAITAEEVAEAEAYLKENATPLPDGWSFQKVTFGDAGGFVRVGHAAPDKPVATVLFVPGYTSSPELASDFIAKWFALGIEVASIDLPGQGGSVRRDDDAQKTYTGDFSLYGQAVGAGFDHIKARRVSEGPLIVAGDSLGGHVILRATADGELEGLDGLFPLVPGLTPELGPVPVWLVRWMTKAAIDRGRGTDYMAGEGPWSPDAWDPEVMAYCGRGREDRIFKNQALFRTRSDLRVGGASQEFGFGFVRSGRELAKSASLAALAIPVTMVTAGQERVVKTADAEKLCRDGMQNCDLIRIEDADHCLYLSPERIQDQVHKALLQLIERAKARG
ncbi:MAG: alpha/beta fold hydrolase [Pseudomonadota bacterium]